MPADPEPVILRAVSDLARTKGFTAEVGRDHRLTRDLELESLDIAELVAVLELELATDPFVADASIADARTVGDLVDIYRRHLGY